MDWTQFIIFFIGVFGLFIWVRTESRNDIRHMDNKLDSMRDLIHTIHTETHASLNGIREEIRDFHGRLCDIEKRKN
jgi:hypothetical protein